MLLILRELLIDPESKNEICFDVLSHLLIHVKVFDHPPL